MNSGLRKLPIIGLAGFILIGIALGSKPKTTLSEANPASFLERVIPFQNWDLDQGPNH